MLKRLSSLGWVSSQDILLIEKSDLMPTSSRRHRPPLTVTVARHAAPVTTDDAQTDQRPSAWRRGYDARWRRLRLMILRRDKFVCCVCGKPGATEVDHIKPLVEGGENDDGNLQSLCRRCHAIKTGRDAKAKRAMEHGGLG